MNKRQKSHNINDRNDNSLNMTENQSKNINLYKKLYDEAKELKFKHAILTNEFYSEKNGMTFKPKVNSCKKYKIDIDFMQREKIFSKSKKENLEKLKKEKEEKEFGLLPKKNTSLEDRHKNNKEIVERLYKKHNEKIKEEKQKKIAEEKNIEIQKRQTRKSKEEIDTINKAVAQRLYSNQIDKIKDKNLSLKKAKDEEANKLLSQDLFYKYKKEKKLFEFKNNPEINFEKEKNKNSPCKENENKPKSLIKKIDVNSRLLKPNLAASSPDNNIHPKKKERTKTNSGSKGKIKKEIKQNNSSPNKILKPGSIRKNKINTNKIFDDNNNNNISKDNFQNKNNLSIKFNEKNNSKEYNNLSPIRNENSNYLTDNNIISNKSSYRDTDVYNLSNLKTNNNLTMNIKDIGRNEKNNFEDNNLKNTNSVIGNTFKETNVSNNSNVNKNSDGLTDHNFLNQNSENNSDNSRGLENKENKFKSKALEKILSGRK